MARLFVCLFGLAEHGQQRVLQCGELQRCGAEILQTATGEVEALQRLNFQDGVVAAPQ